MIHDFDETGGEYEEMRELMRKITPISEIDPNHIISYDPNQKYRKSTEEDAKKLARMKQELINKLKAELAKDFLAFHQAVMLLERNKID